MTQPFAPNYEALPDKSKFVIDTLAFRVTNCLPWSKADAFNQIWLIFAECQGEAAADAWLNILRSRVDRIDSVDPGAA